MKKIESLIFGKVQYGRPLAIAYQDDEKSSRLIVTALRTVAAVSKAAA